MILNDWLRGKIPYYTSPPEHVETDVNKKALLPIPGVEQRFSKIRVESSYLPEDIQCDDEPIEKMDEDANAEVLEQIEKEQVQESVDWDDIFQDVKGEPTNALPGDGQDKTSGVDSSDSGGSCFEDDEGEASNEKKHALVEEDGDEDSGKFTLWNLSLFHDIHTCSYFLC
jgi:nuclear GTP-binding protein